MKNLLKWAVVVSNVFLLVACSPPLPKTDLDDPNSAANQQHFKWENRSPLRKVKLAGDFFISKELSGHLPADKSDVPISLKFSSRIATLGDLVFMLEQKGIDVAYHWTVYDNDIVSSSSVATTANSFSMSASSNSDSDFDFDFDDGGDNSSSSGSSSSSRPVVNDASIRAINSLEQKVLPFKAYKGTLKGLMERVQSSMNIAYWWDDGSLFLSTNQEYVVSVPQQKDIIDSIVSEITALGATDVSSSLTGGQIVYYAKPRSQKNLIEPFLKRISQNLSEITLQVALVQVDIQQAEKHGFDWDAFNLEITSPLSGDTNSNDVTITPFGSTEVGGNIKAGFFRRGISIFGTKTDVTVDMAINILSTLGRTTTEQNVEMRTISGKEVSLSSTKEESYVSGYDGGSYGDNPEPPSPEFDTVSTGLILTFLPVFDAYNGIVTIDSNFELSGRLSDTISSVNAGSGYEEVTVRPNIKKDNFEDIVRIPLGETVIVGGLSSERFEDNRTTPMGFWDVNSAKQNKSKEALFLIIRPLVTLYVTEGNEALIEEREFEKRFKYNYGKDKKRMQEDLDKANAEAEERRIEEERIQQEELEKVRQKVEIRAKNLQLKEQREKEAKALLEEQINQAKEEKEQEKLAVLLQKEKEMEALKKQLAKLEEEKKEAKARQEAISKARQEAIARMKAEKEAKARAIAEKEAEELARQEAKAKREAEKAAEKLEKERIKREKELKKAAEVRAKRIEKERAKAEEERIKAEVERAKAEAKRMKAEAEKAKKQAEKEAKAETKRIKAEAEKAKQEAENIEKADAIKAKQEAEARAKAEAAKVSPKAFEQLQKVEKVQEQKEEKPAVSNDETLKMLEMLRGVR